MTTRKRITYTIPPPSTPIPKLSLPPLHTPRNGRPSPILLPSTSNPTTTSTINGHTHHRHRLGVVSLAIDSSTPSSTASDTPEGILYSGGRDGMIIAWDLHMPHRPRKVKSGGGERERGRWEALMGWEDEEEYEDDEDDDASVGDGDVLGDVKPVGKKEMGWNGGEMGVGCMERDWINDLLLINSNQTLISASSDGSIRAWNPHLPQNKDTSVIGQHTDYVRTLAHSPVQKWVASGSCDRSIKLWDPSYSSPSTPSPIQTLTATGSDSNSIYSLCTTDYGGTTLASGGPEKVVRLWDVRSGKGVGTLVGHTDVVRAVKGGWGGEYLLTASSDTTIKLWSLRSPSKCLHTFTPHDSSVWTLYSSHPRLEVFYSGDKEGYIGKVDVRGVGELGDAECALVGKLDGGEGVGRVVGGDGERWVWSVSERSDILRWKDPGPRSERLSSSPSAILFSSSMRDPFADPEEEQTNGETDRKDGIPYDSLVRLESPIALGVGGGGVGMGLPNGTFGSFAFHSPNATATPVASPFIPTSPHPLSPPHPTSSPPPLDQSPPSPTARSLYQTRDTLPSALPLCSAPEEVISGTKGLTRAILLNDRVHAISVDTDGEVWVWDVVRGKAVGFFEAGVCCDTDTATNTTDTNTDTGKKSKQSPRETLENIRERIEGENVVNAWCTLDTRVGEMSVVISERCFEAECFLDEIEGGDGEVVKGDVEEEYRVNIARWALTNLFASFIDSLLPPPPGSGKRGKPTFIPLTTSSSYMTSMSMRSPPIMTALPTPGPAFSLISGESQIGGLSAIPQSPVPVPGSGSGSGSGNETPKPRPAAGTPSSAGDARGLTPLVTPGHGTGEHDYFSPRAQNPSRDAQVPPTPDDFSGWNVKKKDEKEEKEPPTPVTVPMPTTTPGGTGFMKRLKPWKSSKKLSDAAHAGAAAGGKDAVPAGATDDKDTTPTPEKPKSAVSQILSSTPPTPLAPPTPRDAPRIPIPPSTQLTLSEELEGNWAVVYRGVVGSLGDEAERLRLNEVLPAWVAECVLLNKVPAYVPPKISFMLMPWKGSGLRELSNSSSKLTASRFLRARKVSNYVQEKLDKAQNRTSTSTASSTHSLPTGPASPPALSAPTHTRKHSNSVPADEIYEILCNDMVLPWNMTLAVVKHYIWRQSGGELLMHYRKKVASPS